MLNPGPSDACGAGTHPSVASRLTPVCRARGRLESRLRFSNTLVWNTFPVRPLDAATRQKIIDAGQLVLLAREQHPERSLAEHYNPLAMSPELIKAHEKLDREVDKAFGAARKLTTERQRQELLFSNYAALTSQNG